MEKGKWHFPYFIAPVGKLPKTVQEAVDRLSQMNNKDSEGDWIKLEENGYQWFIARTYENPRAWHVTVSVIVDMTDLIHD